MAILIRIKDHMKNKQIKQQQQYQLQILKKKNITRENRRMSLLRILRRKNGIFILYTYVYANLTTYPLIFR